jgi:redox-sensing transcriptional repressor
MSQYGKIPRPTVKRLSFYLRELEALAAASETTINSRQLGETLGLTDAQVRKDLAYFGQFGHPGIGYRIPDLAKELRRILGTDRKWTVAVVGAGNLGRAVASYGRLARKGFTIDAVFDRDPALVDTVIAGHKVRPLEDLTAIIRERDIQIGMVAVPAEAAQDIADALIDAGVRGILNFAPVRLQIGESVSIVSVDLTVSLEQLAFRMALGVLGETDESQEPAS